MLLGIDIMLYWLSRRWKGYCGQRRENCCSGMTGDGNTAATGDGNETVTETVFPEINENTKNIRYADVI